MPLRDLLCLLLVLPVLTLLAACPQEEGDDDDRTIEPPAECSNPALSTVNFTFNIHYDGEDYPQDELLGLMAEWGMETFSFNFTPAVVTERANWWRYLCNADELDDPSGTGGHGDHA